MTKCYEWDAMYVKVNMDDTFKQTKMIFWHRKGNKNAERWQIRCMKVIWTYLNEEKYVEVVKTTFLCHGTP